MDSPTEETAPPSRRSSSQKEVLLWMFWAFFAWFLVYMGQGYMVPQGQDGFFARTVDRIEANWVKFVFLNVPLQILLMFVPAVCACSERPAVLRLGLWVGALTGVLVLVHIILSVATA